MTPATALRLFGVTPTATYSADQVSVPSGAKVQLDTGRILLKEYDDRPIELIETAEGSIVVGSTHALFMGADGNVTVKGLEEAAKHEPTRNKAWGFWGTISDLLGEKAAAVLWDGLSTSMLSKFKGTSPAAVRAYLDSTTGRHTADSVLDAFYDRKSEGPLYDAKKVGPAVEQAMGTVSLKRLKEIEKLLKGDAAAFDVESLLDAGANLTEALDRGARVRINYASPEREHFGKHFHGKTGTIIGSEKDGSTTLYRVKLDDPADVPNVGKVEDDLWAGKFLKRIKESEDMDEAQSVGAARRQRSGIDWRAGRGSRIAALRKRDKNKFAIPPPARESVLDEDAGDMEMFFNVSDFVKPKKGMIPAAAGAAIMSYITDHPSWHQASASARATIRAAVSRDPKFKALLAQHDLTLKEAEERNMKPALREDDYAEIVFGDNGLELHVGDAIVASEDCDLEDMDACRRAETNLTRQAEALGYEGVTEGTFDASNEKGGPVVNGDEEDDWKKGESYYARRFRRRTSNAVTGKPELPAAAYSTYGESIEPGEDENDLECATQLVSACSDFLAEQLEGDRDIQHIRAFDALVAEGDYEAAIDMAEALAQEDGKLDEYKRLTGTRLSRFRRSSKTQTSSERARNRQRRREYRQSPGMRRKKARYRIKVRRFRRKHESVEDVIEGAMTARVAKDMKSRGMKFAVWSGDEDVTFHKTRAEAEAEEKRRPKTKDTDDEMERTWTDIDELIDVLESVDETGMRPSPELLRARSVDKRHRVKMANRQNNPPRKMREWSDAAREHALDVTATLADEFIAEEDEGVYVHAEHGRFTEEGVNAFLRAAYLDAAASIDEIQDDTFKSAIDGKGATDDTFKSAVLGVFGDLSVGEFTNFAGLKASLTASGYVGEAKDSDLMRVLSQLVNEGIVTYKRGDGYCIPEADDETALKLAKGARMAGKRAVVTLTQSKIPTFHGSMRDAQTFWNSLRPAMRGMKATIGDYMRSIGASDEEAPVEDEAAATA